jgi:poly-gamma-glutamate capsule biosynthesis protein CapA/YwtB (metallophosphatase superfamily)
MPYIAISSPRKKQKRSKKPLIAIFVVLAVIGIGSWLLLSKDKAQAPAAVEVQKTEVSSNVDSVTAKYLFSGTVVPARAVENEARRADGSIDYNQPFSQLNTFNPSQYNEWVIDMECPITDATIPYRTQVANTVFNCRPEFLPAMSKYFTVFNLANNHVYDQGKEKFPQMQKYVQDAGIQYLGNQDPSATKDVCEVMAMGVTIKDKDGKTTKGDLPMAFCAWHYFEREPYAGEFDVMKQYAEIMPVVGLMQVGVEYVPKADARQESVSRTIIDGGAEFVIGNSPHWVQNSDVYKNKLIFYSTGNFIFDQLDAETNRGASIEVSMQVDYDENVGKWLALGKTCQAHYDDCLAKAKEQQLKKIQPKFTYNLLASTTGYQQVTKKADASTQSAVEARANWLTTLKGLGQ